MIYEWNLSLTVVKTFELKETLFWFVILILKLYKNITYTSTFFPTRTYYMDGFPEQTALAQLHFLRVQFLGRPHRNTVYSTVS
jgi:hypothetical protein